MVDKSPHDSDYGRWLMNVSRLNGVPLPLPAVLDDGTPDSIRIESGDAYIHRETGVILAFVLTDDHGVRHMFALDHADRSFEPLRDAIHAFLDSRFLRNLRNATPLGRLINIAGAVVRHYWRWDKEPAGTGYYLYPEGKLLFRGTYTLEEG
ncbi:hypothetical protein [Streptomyces sp. CMB-StM0423]|uniref:hypothetical protein n=1 Tax=Streptomyces sp. CMB-StM0423 TaxID=2059884 RepID=UPI000C6FF6E8|nr:hypothetical protein [Streptomyces sp. CMB-StM0423]AUH39999.1 hypothetical protein CXR04_06840 [Streptomyces sp. CMB-StM0423]